MHLCIFIPTYDICIFVCICSHLLVCVIYVLYIYACLSVCVYVFVQIFHLKQYDKQYQIFMHVAISVCIASSTYSVLEGKVANLTIKMSSTAYTFDCEVTLIDMEDTASGLVSVVCGGGFFCDWSISRLSASHYMCSEDVQY